MSDFFSNKKVFITGGTGSLGRSLTKKLKEIGSSIVVYSRDEGKQALYFGQDKDVKTIIGDVRDYRKLRTSLLLEKPDLVIHTAAMKRVDDMEHHPDECVKTNINGSDNVARASLESGVSKCALISTDKACMPVNVYGSSKFIAERIFTNYDYNSSHTKFLSVRYGNVIASRGSFIPLWIGLLKENKNIQVTSLDCTRFLFPLSDAVKAVLGAIENSQGGEVFVPMIDSFTMSSCINTVGKLIDIDDVPFDVVGMRPGEKIHEDMLCKTELRFSYKVPDINLIQVRPQYSNRDYKDWPKYEGDELNSSLHVNKDEGQLYDLIKKGLSE